jgi:hypothetical protein
LQEQVSRLTKANKALSEEVAELREMVVQPPVAKSATAAPALPRATHIDAGDPAQDCVIRPGSKNPLADCLR